MKALIVVMIFLCSCGPTDEKILPSTSQDTLISKRVLAEIISSRKLLQKQIVRDSANYNQSQKILSTYDSLQSEAIAHKADQIHLLLIEAELKKVNEQYKILLEKLNKLKLEKTLILEQM